MLSSDNERNCTHFSSDQGVQVHCESNPNRPKMSSKHDNNDESEIIETNYEYNTFIFNWVRNYDKQVNILKEALESLQNKVQIYDNLKEEELLKVVEDLSRNNFKLFNYICIIILDNQSKYAQFIQTADKVHVLLETEILTKIKSNSTLKNVTRLFVIQKLSDIRDVDDEELDKINEMIHQRKKKSQGLEAITFGLSKTLTAYEYTDNYLDSPFLEVFSQKYRDHARTKTMNEIFNSIRKELKERKYNVNIEDGGNELQNSDLIFGNGIRQSVLRDFFD